MEACSIAGASRPIRKMTVLGVGGVGGLLAGQLFFAAGQRRLTLFQRLGSFFVHGLFLFCADAPFSH